MNGIEELIQSFFELNHNYIEIKNTALVVARADGVPLYSVNDYSKWNDSTVGALVGGMWQAAETIIKFIPDADNDEFRLNFDSTSRGIFIVKVETGVEPLFLSLMYFDLINPAKVKSKMRKMQTELAFYIEENIDDVIEENSSDLLFDNITDDEMDNLFMGFGG